MNTPDHLNVTTSDRGLGYLPPIPGSYGDQPTGAKVQVYVSSAAEGPHIWLLATAPVDLNNPDGPTRQAPVHLTVENAAKLVDQLNYLIANHYQRPS